MSIHVMADIETWSTRNNALIVSIGAVKFDAENIIDRFHVGIDPVDAQRFGLHIDAGTVLYWFGPKMAEAREQLMALPKVDLFAALDGFAIWVNQTPVDDRGSLWGKGATFDNVILASAYEAAKIDFPFSYRQNECYRTLANRCPNVEYAQVGVAHDALDDATSQAFHLQAIVKHCGLSL
jgi:hypothetical protein